MKQLSRVEPTWRLPEVAPVPASTEPGQATGISGRGLEAIRELALVAALFGLYEVGRGVAAGHVSRAFANASAVWHIERWLHLPDEAVLQAPLVAHPELARAANIFYASVHFPLTIAVLVLLWWFRPADFRWTRNVMATMTFAGLVLHLGLPLAPPRMLAGVGMVDLGHIYGPSVYGDQSTGGFSDQFAAMPSLHVGWAVLVAVAAIRVLPTGWRYLALLHPLMTLTVVVVTGNHYWLDGAVSVLLLAIAIQVQPRRGVAWLPGWRRVRPLRQMGGSVQPIQRIARPR